MRLLRFHSRNGTCKPTSQQNTKEAQNNSNDSFEPTNFQDNKDDNRNDSPETKEFPVDDLICPITLELPWDPVTAEDGRVYERSAIEEHFNTQCDNIKSPMTNARMGKRLFPAPQHKNLIRSLIESGALKGDLVSKWNDKVNDKKPTLLKKAESGDMHAMYEVGRRFYSGIEGFKQDFNLAYTWSKKAQEAGDVTAMAMVGVMLIRGRGATKSHSRGVFYMTMAAGKGSRFAMWQVSKYLARGKYGLEVNKEEAICGLRGVLNDTWVHDRMTSEHVKQARTSLDELTVVDN